MGDQINVAVRYAVTSASSVIATLVALHFISDGDATTISNALTQIGTGISSIVAGVTALIPFAMAILGLLKSTQKAKIADVKAITNVDVVPAGPGGAELIASAVKK